MGYTNNKHLVIDRDTRWDKKISFYVVFYFFAEIANATIKTVLPIPDALFGVLSALWGVAIVFFMFRGIRGVWERSSTIFLRSILLFTIIYLFSFMQIVLRNEPLQGFFRGTLFLTFAWWIPVGVFSCSVKNKRILYETFLKWSYPMSFLLMTCVFFRGGISSDVAMLEEGQVEYNMFFGFHMVLPTLLHFMEYKRTQKRILLFLFIFELFLILIYGNRGALLPFFFFFLYEFVLGKGIALVIKIRNFLLITIVSLIMLIFSNLFLNILGQAAQSIGVQSRTLTLMSAGEISNPTGRDKLSEIAIDMILERPILGWGLGGEYYKIAAGLGQQTIGQTKAVFTPHNGVLQNLVDFGIFFGSIITLILAIPLFRINKCADPYTYRLLLIFGSLTIPWYISGSGFFIYPLVAVFVYLFYFNH